MNNGSLGIRMGIGTATVTAGPSEVWFHITDHGSKDVTGKQVPLADAADLVLHLVEKLPIFSDASFYAVKEDVSTYLGRELHNKKVKDLMEKLSVAYFGGRELAYLTIEESNLLHRTATAEVALAEAEGK